MKQVEIAGFLKASQIVFSRLLKKREAGIVKDRGRQERPKATTSKQDMLLLPMSRQNVFVSCVNIKDSPAE